jgi:hypothetical protein
VPLFESPGLSLLISTPPICLLSLLISFYHTKDLVRPLRKLLQILLPKLINSVLFFNSCSYTLPLCQFPGSPSPVPTAIPFRQSSKAGHTPGQHSQPPRGGRNCLSPSSASRVLLSGRQVPRTGHQGGCGQGTRLMLATFCVEFGRKFPQYP